MYDLLTFSGTVLLVALAFVLICAGIALLRLPAALKTMHAPVVNETSTVTISRGGSTIADWSNMTAEERAAAEDLQTIEDRKHEPAIRYPITIEGVEDPSHPLHQPDEDAVECGNCNRMIESAPTGSKIKDGVCLMSYTCEHCGTAVTLREES